MSCNIQTICQWIESLFPKNLAEKWDNVGFQVGNPRNRVDNVLLALDMTDNVVNEAISKECGLIITHHPLIFSSLKSINADTLHGGLIGKLFKNDIALYSAHTNMDIAQGGINDYIADALNITATAPLSITGSYKLYKMIVFVPDEYSAKIKQTAADSGAGNIGNYSNCSFSSTGEGSFMPLEGSHAFIGAKDRLETVSETRIEFVVPETALKRVVASIKKAHPYEEMAYDIFEIETGEEAYGIGRIGRLVEPTSINNLIIACKDLFKTENLRVISQIDYNDCNIIKVAVCSGSGGSLIRDAIRKGVDVFITGEVKYHEALDAYHQGLTIIEAGHFETETIFMKKLAYELKDIAKTARQEVQFIVSEEQTSIFTHA